MDRLQILSRPFRSHIILFRPLTTFSNRPSSPQRLPLQHNRRSLPFNPRSLFQHQLWYHFLPPNSAWWWPRMPVFISHIVYPFCVPFRHSLSSPFKYCLQPLLPLKFCYCFVLQTGFLTSQIAFFAPCVLAYSSKTTSSSRFVQTSPVSHVRT